MESLSRLTIPDALTVSGTASGSSQIKLFEDTDNGTNFVALKAPATLAADKTFTLPNADGTTGQALITDGSGGLSFGDVGLTAQQVRNIVNSYSLII